MKIIEIDDYSYFEYKELLKIFRRTNEDFILHGKCSMCGKDFKKKYAKEENFSLCKGCSSKNGMILKSGSIEAATKKRLEKTKQTCLKKYGCEYSFQSKDTKDKIKRTFVERYGDGVTNPSQVKEFRDKVKQTFLNKYGDEEFLRTKICKDKTEQTSIEKYGTKSPNSSNFVKENKKQSCLKKYGVTNPNKLKTIQDKVSKTCFEKYGRRWNVYKYYYDENRFDSSYELILYIYLKKINANFKFHPIEYFSEYYINGQKHVYEPDFLIDGKLFEIKGSHFFDENGNLIDIYGDKHLLKEKQNHMNSLNVNIITERSELMVKAFEYFKSLNLSLDSFKKKK